MIETIDEKYLNDSVTMLPMREILADEEFNCRGFINPANTKLLDLARNIQEQGLIQPIIVRPYNKGEQKYEVVAGFRRFKAHQINKAEHIKAIIRTDLTDDTAKFLNLSENLNREDLDMLQEAKSVQELYDRGFTQEEIKEKLNVSRFWVNIRLKVMKLDPQIQTEIKAGWLTQEHIGGISSLKSLDKQLEVIRDIKEKKQKNDGSRITISKKSLQKNPNSKLKRPPHVIQQMIDHILMNFGGNLATRALAWTNGVISSNDLFNDLKELAESDGIDYDAPTEDFA